MAPKELAKRQPVPFYTPKARDFEISWFDPEKISGAPLVLGTTEGGGDYFIFKIPHSAGEIHVTVVKK
jgi:hypothetical protein